MEFRRITNLPPYVFTIINNLKIEARRAGADVIDLSTRYLGLRLASPLVASPSPLCERLDNVRRLEDAGAAAIVLHSLFEEQIEVESQHLDRYLSCGTESYADSTSYFPDLHDYNLGPDGYLEHVRNF